MSVDTTKKAETMNRMLEYAVPLLGFMGVFIGIGLLTLHAAIDVRISIIGCLLSSFVLAYLAWIRPKKDIVALSTPIYSIIFLGFPLDDVSTVVLDVLYAASLTFLLVRLRNRFGASGALVKDKTELAEPIKSYLEKNRETLVSAGPESAHSAAKVFVRFAQGDFLAAAGAAESAIARMNNASTLCCLHNAFAIVQEQAERLDKSVPQPERFRTFPPEDVGVLAKIADPKANKAEMYDTALENALILIFACAWTASEKDRPHLLQFQTFVLKLLD
jgi:hypothetical protein